MADNTWNQNLCQCTDWNLDSSAIIWWIIVFVIILLIIWFIYVQWEMHVKSTGYKWIYGYIIFFVVFILLIAIYELIFKSNDVSNIDYLTILAIIVFIIVIAILMFYSKKNSSN